MDDDDCFSSFGYSHEVNGGKAKTTCSDLMEDDYSLKIGDIPASAYPAPVFDGEEIDIDAFLVKDHQHNERMDLYDQELCSRKLPLLDPIE
jgi:hypothetical protein